ncbi:polyphosphate kinase 2 family protein [Granulosicoccus sp. 3-233]|uniref:polyphosphate kinase 2 family protein n=1 Tax=Granulosicoccus sp. 3-233 TaxID=3417969 RepID=UPI003D3377FC
MPALPEKSVISSPFMVPHDGRFTVADSPAGPGKDVAGKKALEKQLADAVEGISELQRKLYADDRYSLLLIFQAMDAAGKDGTIRAVMSGVNPAGCQVSSFKSPSDEELEHDWLWRTTRRLPERGRIGIFNRSYYEEVLAVRVHPEYLQNQRLPRHQHEALWQERFESIRDHEKHLSRNGTVVLKFWLNVSKDEQKKRFLKRLTTPEKYWKFSDSDLVTRDRWDEYMQTYESMLNETSTTYAPWFAIPADDKRYMRVCVAEIIQQTLEALPLRYPEKAPEEIAKFEEYIARLEGETD